MTHIISPLRHRLDELDVYVSRVAEETGIPASHLEKDFWVTEVLRGATKASTETGCSVIFKGGTSLSKAHRLIQRFSEDVDLIIVLPEAGRKSRNKNLKAFVTAAETATGITARIDAATTTTGIKRNAVFQYPTTRTFSALKQGVLMELGTRGGAIPNRRLPITSLLAEHANAVGLPLDFLEAEPFSILVLDPVRTLVEKLVLLHHAATQGDEHRQTSTARHYYDVDRLLRDDTVRTDLARIGVDILARETVQHSKAADLATAERPPGGFAASKAWSDPLGTTAVAYETVLTQLVWPSGTVSSFEACCELVQELAPIL